MNYNKNRQLRKSKASSMKNPNQETVLSKKAKQFIIDEGIEDITGLVGTGKAGKITKKDVKKFSKSSGGTSTSSGSTSTTSNNTSVNTSIVGDITSVVDGSATPPAPTPAAKKLIKKNKLDINLIQGTGADDRILVKDVNNFIKSQS